MEAVNIYVLPVAMFGCESWVFRSGQGDGRDLEKETIRKWHMRYVRRMAGVGIGQQIAERITDESIMTENKQLPLVLKCEAKQWRFIRHCYRQAGGRWSKFAFTAKLYGDNGNRYGRQETLQKRIRRLGREMANRFPQDHDKPFDWQTAKKVDGEEWMHHFWEYHEVPKHLRPGAKKTAND
jgi:hypothetical protein